MSTKSCTLIPYYLQDHNISSWQKGFSLIPKGDNRVLKAQKTTFSSGRGLCNILFLSLSELSICLKNLIFTRGVEHLERNYFPPGGMLKFTNKGHLLTTKKAYKKLLYWKSKRQAHALVLLLNTRFLFLKKH